MRWAVLGLPPPWGPCLDFESFADLEIAVAYLDPASQRALLDEMFAAFNRHDAAGVVATMTPDAVFEAAAGPEVHGLRYSGREAIAQAFAKLFGDLPDVRWDEVQHYPAGDTVTTTWIMRATRPDGARIEAEGIDLFTLREGKVAVKRAFRKDRPPQRS